MGQPELWKFFLLPAYVASETTRALLTFSAVQSDIPVSSVLVALFSELVKFATALFFLARSNEFNMDAITAQLFFSSEVKPYLATCVPAVLYLVNSLLYMVALGLTTPSFLHIAMLAKIPITAIFHHFIIRKQTSHLAWTALAFITLGMFVCNLPSDFLSMIGLGSPLSEIATSAEQSTSAPGLFIGLFIALVSGLTSTYTEVIFKRKTPFWVTQTWLYAFGSVASASVYCVWGGFNKTIDSSPPRLQSFVWHIALVIAVALTGLVIANILRKKDNLVKLVGISTSIVVIILVEYVLFPSLRATTFSLKTGIGVTIISFSTWAYNRYKDPQPPLEEAKVWEIGEEEEGDHIEEGGTKMGGLEYQSVPKM